MKKVGTCMILAVVLLASMGAGGLADDSEVAMTPGVPVQDPITCEFNQGLGSCPVQFELYFNLIFLPASINNSSGCWFIVDTGFEYSLLNMDRLSEHDLTAGVSATEAQPGGEIEVAEVDDVSISFPCLETHFESIKAIPLAGLEPIIGRRLDGIIGHDIFSRLVVDIDYDLEVITFHPGKGFKYSGGGQVIPLTFADDQSFFFAEVIQPERGPVKAKLKLDTGSSDFIGFNGSFVLHENLIPDSQFKLPALGTAVGGHTDNWVTRMMGFKIDNISFDNPVVGYSVDTLRGGDAGTIGGEFFKRFRTIFDYKQKRLILEKGRRYDDPFEYDMSGVFPIALAPDFATKTILAVTADSPAATAGLLPGDVIEMVDGMPAGKLSIADLRRMFMQPGASYQLSILRGDQQLEVTLTLERMI